MMIMALIILEKYHFLWSILSLEFVPSLPAISSGNLAIIKYSLLALWDMLYIKYPDLSSLCGKIFLNLLVGL